MDATLTSQDHVGSDKRRVASITIFEAAPLEPINYPIRLFTTLQKENVSS
jgi:hypothetical protein